MTQFRCSAAAVVIMMQLITKAPGVTGEKAMAAWLTSARARLSGSTREVPGYRVDASAGRPAA
jgi:hypothetical protein